MGSGTELFRGNKTFRAAVLMGAAAVISQTASALSLSYQSIDTPALTVFNGQVVMAYTGTDSNHRLNYAVSSDGVTFTQVADNANRAASGPAIAAFGAKTYAAFTGINDHKINIYSSTDGQHYSGQSVPNGTWNSPWRISMASGGGYIYLAWLGYDNNIYIIRSSNGTSWAMYRSITHFTSVNTPSGASNGPVYPPTLATDSTGAVQMVYTNQFYASYGIPTYQIIRAPAVLGGSTTTCRSYVNDVGIQAGLGFLPSETLMPWFPGQGNRIAFDLNGGSCAGGTTYPTSGAPSDGNYYGLTGVAPAAVGFNGHAFLYWTGTDSAQHINVLEIF
jgi:hypothetical protein